MKEKKSGGRRAYLRDFKKDASGKYVYAGKHIIYSADNAMPFKRWFARLCVFNAAAVAASTTSGFLPFGGLNNCIYVLLPLVLEFGLTAWALYGPLSSGARSRMRAYVFDSSFKHLSVKNTAALLSALVGAVGALVFSLLGNTDTPVWTVLYILLKLLAAFCQLFSSCTVRGARWEEK